jgi:hypothetical protein
MCPSPWKPVVDTWADTPILPVDPRYRTVFHVGEPGANVSLPVEACGMDTWADTHILLVDPRYRTVFPVDEPGAHVSLPMEACGGHLGRHAYSICGPQVQNSIPCRRAGHLCVPPHGSLLWTPGVLDTPILHQQGIVPKATAVVSERRWSRGISKGFP